MTADLPGWAANSDTEGKVDIYAALMERKCFTRSDVVAVTGDERSADSLLKKCLEEKCTDRVREEQYVMLDPVWKAPVADEVEIGCAVADDAVIANHSAFEMYGGGNQIYNEL